MTVWKMNAEYVAFALLIYGVTSQNLDCNFDAQNFCSWTNEANADDFDWQVADRVALDGWHSIARSITGSGFFAFAQGNLRPASQPNAKAQLVSEEIQGTSAATELRFFYWKTAVPPIIRICSRQSGLTNLQCFDTISGGQITQGWTERRVTIPADPLTFQIIFEASNFNSDLDLLGIDDITWTGSVPLLDGVSQFRPVPDELLPKKLSAKTTNFQLPMFEDDFGGEPPATFRTPVVPLQPPPTVRNSESRVYLITAPEIPVGACPAVSCSFNAGYCQWFNGVSSNFEWKLRNRETGLPGIPQDSSSRESYIYVNGDGRLPIQRAVLKSPKFVVPSRAYLEFYAFISDSYRGRLAVYKNNPFDSHNIAWEAMGNDQLGGPGWKRWRIPIEQSATPLDLIFVADSMDQQGFIGVDNVRLIDYSSREIGCASDPTFFRKTASQALDPQEVSIFLSNIPESQGNRLVRVTRPEFSEIETPNPTYPIPADLKPATSVQDLKENGGFDPAGLRGIGVDNDGQFIAKPVIKQPQPHLPFFPPPIQIQSETIEEILRSTTQLSEPTTSSTATPSTETSIAASALGEDSGWVTVKAPIVENSTSASLTEDQTGVADGPKEDKALERYLANVVQGLGQELGSLLGLPSANQINRLTAQRSLNPGQIPLSNPNADPWNILSALKQQGSGYQSPQIQSPSALFPLGSLLGGQQPPPQPDPRLLGLLGQQSPAIPGLAGLFGQQPQPQGNPGLAGLFQPQQQAPGAGLTLFGPQKPQAGAAAALEGLFGGPTAAIKKGQGLESLLGPKSQFGGTGGLGGLQGLLGGPKPSSSGLGSLFGPQVNAQPVSAGTAESLATLTQGTNSLLGGLFGGKRKR